MIWEGALSLALALFLFGVGFLSTDTLFFSEMREIPNNCMV
jgi:hypothetical protein